MSAETYRFAVDFLPGLTGRPGDDSSHVTEGRLAAIRLGEALRVLLERVVSTGLDADDLVELADEVDRLSRALEEEHHGDRAVHALDDMAAGLRMFNPVVGLANPVSPPMHLFVERDGAQLGRLEFGQVYEGIPGHVHGGFTASVLDQAMARANGLAGMAGVTLSMTVDYRRAVPLHHPLVIWGEVTRWEGRKVWTRSWLTSEGDAASEPFATAEGLYLQMSGERLLGLSRGGPVDGNSILG